LLWLFWRLDLLNYRPGWPLTLILPPQPPKYLER
jgi:hypothetical protein